MENRGRPAAVTSAASRTATRPSAPATAGTPEGPAVGWLVSPGFDLLLVANVAWPLLLMPGLSGRSETAVDFWQVYFVTLPHRWITLALVVLDPERRGGRGAWLLAVAVAAALLVVGLRLGTGALTCLAVVDYAWNAWHFGAQHAGVLRIYARKVGGGRPWLERHGVRLFVTYAVLRTAGWATGWLGSGDGPAGWLRAADLAVLAVPAALLAFTLRDLTRPRLGKALHTLSFCLLYGGLILALSFQATAWVVPLTTASGLFHATEYLAIVTHYARRRREFGVGGAFRRLAVAWVPILVVYMAALGSMGVLLEGGPAFEFWLGLNLWAALVHYAFDGMIWKLRRPETARLLGGAGPGAVAGALR